MTSWERRWDSCDWHWGQVWSQTTGNPPPLSPSPPPPHPRPPHPHSRASWQARRGGGDSCAQHWGWGGRLNGPRGRLTSAWSPETTSVSNPSLWFSLFLSRITWVPCCWEDCCFAPVALRSEKDSISNKEEENQKHNIWRAKPNLHKNIFWSERQSVSEKQKVTW